MGSLMQRKHKEDISQFLALMNECQPPITSQSRWKEVSRRCSKDARFVALSESVRVSIFNQYLNELAGTEKEAEEAGLQLFKVTLALFLLRLRYCAALRKVRRLPINSLQKQFRVMIRSLAHKKAKQSSKQYQISYCQSADCAFLIAQQSSKAVSGSL